MQRYHNWIQDQFGNAVEGATATIYLFGTTVKATIYDAATAAATIDNPIVTGSDGYFEFAAANDRYDIKLSGTNFAEKTLPGLYLYDGLTGVAGTGTVTSVAMTVPSFLSVAGSPVTGAGTLAVTLATQAANTALMGPTSGAAATPAFRVLHVNDISSLVAIPVTVPAFMAVADATLGPQDTLALSFSTQTANKFLASAVSGGAAVPAFRAMVAADMPVFLASGGSHAPGAVPDPPSSAGTAKFLREDATWATVPFKSQFEMVPALAFPTLAVIANQAITPSGIGSLTIAANTLKVGSRVSVRVRLAVVNPAGGFLNTFECKLGGGSFVANGQSTTSETIRAYEMEFDFLIVSSTAYDYAAVGRYAVGASGRVSGASVVNCITTPGTYSSFDITADQAITFQYSINTGAITSASIDRCEILIYNPA